MVRKEPSKSVLIFYVNIHFYPLNMPLIFPSELTSHLDRPNKNSPRSDPAF